MFHFIFVPPKRKNKLLFFVNWKILISDFKLTSLLDLQVSISICKDELICAKYVNDFFRSIHWMYWLNRSDNYYQLVKNLKFFTTQHETKQIFKAAKLIIMVAFTTSCTRQVDSIILYPDYIHVRTRSLILWYPTQTAQTYEPVLKIHYYYTKTTSTSILFLCIQ